MKISVCNSGTQCERCRDRVKGFQLREQFIKHFKLGEANFFDCPHGVEWGFVPPPKPRVLEAEKTTPEKERRKAKQGGCCGSPSVE